MLLALGVTVLVALALVGDLVGPRLIELVARLRARRQRVPDVGFDPGRDRRAEG